MKTVLFSSSTSPSPSHSSHGSSHREHFSASIMNSKFESAESVIRYWEDNEDASCKRFSLFEGDRREAKEYLRSVTDLQAVMRFLVAEDPSSDKLVIAQNLMKKSMARLQKEFHHILSTNRSYFDPESARNRSHLDAESISNHSSSSDVTNDSEEDEIQVVGDSVSQMETSTDFFVTALTGIADTMISSGYGKECMKIYNSLRKSIVAESLFYLGVEKLSSSQIQKMDWEPIELKTKSWLRAVRIAVTSLFHGERILCEQVFSASPSASPRTAESCFSEVAREGAMTLFGFPHHVAQHKKLSPEKLFRVLDLYDAISELWPEIESTFSYDSVSTVRTQAVNCLIKLGNTVRNLLADFETAIQKDNSKSPVPGGGVHPLTRYVINYLIFVSDYSGILTDILADFPITTQYRMPDTYFSSPAPDGDPASTISERLAWLVLVLLCKLDAYACLYYDVTLSYLFLANNLNYIILKVRTSNLKLLLGDHWLFNHERKVKQFAANFERMGWGRVINSLPNQMADIRFDAARKCFQNFNLAFEQACRKQSTWIVQDPKLRDEIKVSLAKKLVPLYREFYKKYRPLFWPEVGAESIVRYAPDDLGNYLSDLFYGGETSVATTSFNSFACSSSQSRGEKAH